VVELHILEVRNRVTKLLANFGVIDGGIEAGLRSSEGGRANVDAAPIQALHRDAEPLPLGAQQVRGRDATVLHDDRASWLGVPTKLALLCSEREAWRIARNDEA
jgi:hypothetical protein